MPDRTDAICLFSLAVAFHATAAPAASQPVLEDRLSGFGSAVIDGVLSPGEWDGAGTADIDVQIPTSAGGGVVPGTLYVMNDDVDLYLAVEFDFTAFRNSVSFEFDTDPTGNHVVREGNDAILFNPETIVLFQDESVVLESGRLFGRPDTALGGTNDGSGAFANSDGFTVYELSHPLDSNDNARDFSVSAGSVMDFVLNIRVIIPPSNFPDDFGDTRIQGEIVVFPTSDHFQCYSVKGFRLDHESVSLEDQFGSKEAILLRPISLCSPVDKNGEGIRDPGSLLVCYSISKDRSGFERRKVVIENQFGEQALSVRRPEVLCVPSTKIGRDEDGNLDSAVAPSGP